MYIPTKAIKIFKTMFYLKIADVSQEEQFSNSFLNQLPLNNLNL